jgi:hypothetical protein
MGKHHTVQQLGNMTGGAALPHSTASATAAASLLFLRGLVRPSGTSASGRPPAGGARLSARLSAAAPARSRFSPCAPQPAPFSCHTLNMPTASATRRAVACSAWAAKAVTRQS